MSIDRVVEGIRTLEAERTAYKNKVEAAITHIEDRLEFLKDATDYECETLKIEIEKVLKILKGEKVD